MLCVVGAAVFDSLLDGVGCIGSGCQGHGGSQRDLGIGDVGIRIGLGLPEGMERPVSARHAVYGILSAVYQGSEVALQPVAELAASSEICAP